MKTGHARVAPGSHAGLAERDPDEAAIVGPDRDAARTRLAEKQARLEALQELLYAEGRQRLLVVLQGMDTAGKDSTIRPCFKGVDPRGGVQGADRARTGEG